MTLLLGSQDGHLARTSYPQRFCFEKPSGPWTNLKRSELWECRPVTE